MLQIGRYEVIRELGRGAMGVVFEARDPLIGRTVAVKTIRLDALGNPSEAEWLQERLFREARSAGALSHAGIVVVYDVGRHEKLAFIAMERVDGPTLEQVLATGGLPSRSESINILRQTAAALDYAHENGVVHRDIKPANLMLHKGVMLKITDFGIAKITSTQQLTRTGMVMGTPSYMSPEQITAQAVDGRADQFSLAVIAFELLVGRKPFQADTLAGLVHQIVYEERPSARSLRPDLPEAADAVLKRGLARDAKDRYPSCMAYVNALEDGLAKIAAPVLAEATRSDAVENRCTVCGTVLTERQPCSFCASFAGSETVFKKAFGIVDAVQPAEEKPAEVIAEPSESVPPVATEQLTLPLPEAVAADFAEQPQSSPVEPPTPARQDAPEPPLPEPPVAGPENFPAFLTLDRPVPRVRFSLQGGWRPWLAAAAAIVAIAAAVGWMLVDRQPAPEHLASESRGPSVPAKQGQPQTPTPPMPGIDNFSLDRQSIQRGEKVTLTWSVANATDVQITPEIGKVGLKGKRILAPTQTTRFTLSAKGPGGEVYQNVTVEVAMPAPVPAVSAAFSASPSSIRAGESALLQWSVSNAAGVRIDPGLGARPEVGSFRVSPVETTTYTLVVDSAGGETRRTVRIEVAALSAGTLKVNAKDGLKYAWIPPGSFTMGCSPGDNECDADEKPPRRANIAKGFWIGQTEVTQEAYQKMTGENPSNFKGAKLPVESISWNEAQGFCQAVGMRLPTEAEWEYAARAGTTQSRYGDIATIAWYNENSGFKTHEVAQKAANAWGLFDTLGNVWEWTADRYGEGTTLVLRGGSWYYDSRDARVSDRYRLGPENRPYGIGVRCVGDRVPVV